MLERDRALRTENANGEGVFRWQRRDTVFSMGHSSHHGLAARVRPLRQASASSGNCREPFAELRTPAHLRNSPQIFPLAPPAMPPAAATAHPPRSRFVESLPSAGKSLLPPVRFLPQEIERQKPNRVWRQSSAALLIKVQCRRQPESNLHHLVCQLVRIEGAGWKVPRQFRAA
jgi:hypothetical protein